MKYSLLLLLLVFMACKDKPTPGIPEKLFDYDRTLSKVVCDSSTNEYAVQVADKYLGDGYYYGLYWPSKLGKEIIFTSYDSAFKACRIWNNQVIAILSDDSLEKLRHHYKECK